MASRKTVFVRVKIKNWRPERYPIVQRMIISPSFIESQISSFKRFWEAAILTPTYIAPIRQISIKGFLLNLTG